MMLVKDAVSHRMCPPGGLIGQAEARGGGLYCGAGLDSVLDPPAHSQRCFLSGHGEMRTGQRRSLGKGAEDEGQSRVCELGGCLIVSDLWKGHVLCFFGPFTFLVTTVNRTQSHKRNQTSYRCCETLNQRLACDAHSHLR